MEKEEIWRDIEGYEGLYQVSNLGRVKSLDRIDRLGRRKPGVILSYILHNYGYLLVNLYKEGKRKLFLVHRLVAHTFIPNPEGLPEINHKDEDKTNNLVDNLEYCDRKYNINYGTHTERMVQTRINNGTYDSELCGIVDKNEHQRLYRQKNRDQINERQRKYRLKRKQEKKKDNRPSEPSLF